VCHPLSVGCHTIGLNQQSYNINLNNKTSNKIQKISILEDMSYTRNQSASANGGGVGKVGLSSTRPFSYSDDRRVRRDDDARLMRQLSVGDLGFPESGSDYTVCKCAIHVRVTSTFLMGCARKPVGRHESISNSSGTMVCHAEPFVREADQRFVELIKTACAGWAFCSPVGNSFMRSYIANAVECEAFGRGYCHLSIVRSVFRWRVARVLGPQPLVAKFLVAYRFVGMYRAKVQLVANGDAEVHVEEVGGTGKGLSGMVIFNRLFAMVVANPRCTIGGYTGSGLHKRLLGYFASPAEPSGILDLLGLKSVALLDGSNLVNVRVSNILVIAQKLLSDAGVELKPEADVDLFLSMHARGGIPSYIPSGVERLRVLALLGDRFLKLHLAVKGSAAGKTVAAMAIEEIGNQSNHAMVAKARDNGVLRSVVAPAGVILETPKVAGDHVEALIGTVFLYGGYEEALKVAAFLDLFG